jgi:two-component system, NtrC family, nitrogen regulation response regulator GlnG
VIEAKDLPPEVLAGRVNAAPHEPPVATGAATPMVVETARVPATAMPIAQTASAVGEEMPVSESILHGWEPDLYAEAAAMLAAGRTDVWDALTHRFEGRMIEAALAHTKGRRIEAAQKLGIGRNTITRKIQELGLDEG